MTLRQSYKFSTITLHYEEKIAMWVKPTLQDTLYNYRTQQGTEFYGSIPPRRRGHNLCFATVTTARPNLQNLS